MTLQPRYGSSEYSAQAEELFAEYVRRRAAGEDLDFESYCGDHPELADELDGLHADWDNLHGLLGRMGVLGGLATGEPEGSPAVGAAGPFGEARAPQPAPPPGDRHAAPHAPARGSGRAWTWGLVLASLVAAGSLARIAQREARAAGALADDNRRLADEVLARDGRLVDLEAARRAAAEAAAVEGARAERLAREALEAARRAQELTLEAAREAQRAEEERRRANDQTELAAEALRRMEEETLRAGEQARLAEESRLVAEAEHRRAEEEARRALEESLRAGSHAQRVQELGHERLLAERRAAAALVALAAERLGRGDGDGARQALGEVEGPLRGFAWAHLEARLADGPRVLFEGDWRGLRVESRRGGPRWALLLGASGLEVLDLVRGERVRGDHSGLGPILDAALDGTGGQLLCVVEGAGGPRLVLLALEPERAPTDSAPGTGADDAPPAPRATRTAELTSLALDAWREVRALGVGRGRWIVWARDAGPHLASAAGLTPLPDPGAPIAAAVPLAGGRELALGLSDGRLLVLPLEESGATGETLTAGATARELLSGGAPISGLAAGLDAGPLAVTDAEGWLRVLDPMDGAELWRARVQVGARAALDADGRLAVRRGPGTVDVRRLADGGSLGQVAVAGAEILACGWGAGGELWLLGADGRLRAAPADAGRAPLALEPEALAALAPGVLTVLARRGEASADSAPTRAADPYAECEAEIRPDGGLLLRDVASGSILLEEPLDPPLAALAFSPDGRHLVAVDAAGEVWVWSLFPEGVRSARRTAPTFGSGPLPR